MRILGNIIAALVAVVMIAALLWAALFFARHIGILLNGGI